MSRKYLKVNRKKNTTLTLLLLIIVILILSMIIPELTVTAATPVYLVQIVVFFTNLRDHLATYWMIYTFIGTVIFAYFLKPKK